MRTFSSAGLGLAFVSLMRAPCMTQGLIDLTCDALEDNQIDWECVFGPGALEEVHQRGGKFTTCSNSKASRHPCSRFVVKKGEERSEVKVQEGPDGFPFKKNEKYIFRYSFRAKEGMKVSKRFTHLGQLKGSRNGYMIKGDPIYSLTANNDGLMVRFSNLESISDYHPGFTKNLNWKESTGQWVHVKITTTFGQSMEVEVSGAVEGKAVWPENLKPVAWHRDSEMVRMKLGLYHKTDEVADGDVEFRNISIEGPNGKIRTSPRREPSGSLFLGCFGDDGKDRVLKRAKYVDAHMTTEMCEDLCEGSEYFGTQAGNECWCGDSKSDLRKHGRSDECVMDCSGERSTHKCGGLYAMSIYQYDGSPKRIPKDTDYLGCFADQPSDRALGLRSTSDDSDMSYERCKKFCSWSDATYFGVQFGKECFCGHDKHDYDKHGSGICDMQCSGDTSLTCGGRGAMNVFRVSGCRHCRAYLVNS